MAQDSQTTGGRAGAIQLLGKLRSGETAPSAITRPERRACVAYLRLEGYTQEEMAEVFQVSRQTIARDERANRKRAARRVEDVDAQAVAGGLIGWAEQLTAKALKEKDYALVWRIRRELVADLQSLGYLPKAPQQHTLQIGTFVDLARLAVDQEGGGTLALPEPEDAEQES